MIINCAKCGKEIIIPDGWSLTADSWRESYCYDCEVEIRNKREK